MAEELVLDAPKTIVFDGFSNVELPLEKIQQPENKVEKTEEKVIEKEVEIKKENQVEDGRNYLKEKLGYEDWDSAKNEIETLRTKAQTPAEIKYANEKSERLAKAWQAGDTDGVYSYLDAEVKLNKLTTGEVTEETAPDIIKAAMKEKYKGLTNDQVNYKFNKQFTYPKEPKFNEGDDEDEFKSKHEDWSNQVSDIKMDMLIEANLARPELEKLKSELKLPEVPLIEPTDKPLTPEEQALMESGLELFLKNAELEVNKFEGFNVEYKDKDVNIKSTYNLSNEEKASVLSKMQLLAEKNYNSNAVFAERWVNDDNTFNYQQMAKDLAILETYDKTNQKFVGDTFAKAKKQFIKEKHNIDLNDGNSAGMGELQLEDKEAQKRNEDALWGIGTN